MKTIGWIARVLGGIQNSIKNYPTRVRKGLIETGDALVYWVKKPKRKDGKPYSQKYLQKKINHYVRQWEANRPKLK